MASGITLCLTHLYICVKLQPIALQACALAAQINQVRDAAGGGVQRCHRLPQPVVPLFPVSSVTGRGLAALHAFLNRLQGASSPVPGPAQQRVAPGMQHQQVSELRHSCLTTGSFSLCWPVAGPSSR